MHLVAATEKMKNTFENCCVTALQKGELFLKRTSEAFRTQVKATK